MSDLVSSMKNVLVPTENLVITLNFLIKRKPLLLLFVSKRSANVVTALKFIKVVLVILFNPLVAL